MADPSYLLITVNTLPTACLHSVPVRFPLVTLIFLEHFVSKELQEFKHIYLVILSITFELIDTS